MQRRGNVFLPRSRRAGPEPKRDEGCREKPKGCLPARFFGQEKEGRQVRRPSQNETLGRFLCLGCWLRVGLRLLLRHGLGGKLLPYLGGDGLGVHLVRGGRILEDGGCIAT